MKKTKWLYTLISASMLFSINLYANPLVYIPLGSGNVVIKVDAASDRIVQTYTGVENSHGIVATPDGEYLIAASLSETPLKKGEARDSKNSKLFFIHPAHGHVMSTIPVTGWSHHMAITPDGKYAIATHGMQGGISVVDLENNQVFKTIKTGMIPNYTLISSDGNFAYVSNSGNNAIAVIDLKSWKITGKLEAGPFPEHMVFSKDEKTIYVTNPRAGKISAVDIKSGKVVHAFKVGKTVHGLDISDDSNRLFVSSKKENKLVAIDIKSRKTSQLFLKPEPYHINTIHGTGKIYISSSSKPLIWVVDQKNLSLVSTIKLPAGEAHQMAIVK